MQLNASYKCELQQKNKLTIWQSHHTGKHTLLDALPSIHAYQSNVKFHLYARSTESTRQLTIAMACHLFSWYKGKCSQHPPQAYERGHSGVQSPLYAVDSLMCGPWTLPLDLSLTQFSHSAVAAPHWQRQLMSHATPPLGDVQQGILGTSQALVSMVTASKPKMTAVL